MSLDGTPHTIPKKIKNDRPTRHEMACLCSPSGIIYRTPSANFVHCSNGVTHCTRCLRPAKRFRAAWTCGPGCVAVPYPENGHV
jgi:hypothetical protein